MSGDELELSDNVKQRIRAEEIYRSEVRCELAGSLAGKPVLTRFFGALNTPLALWFLSSVVLGGMGWAYTQWEEVRTAQAQTRAAVLKLDIEISGRLQRCAARLAFARNSVGLREAIDMLGENSGVFPEFDDRSFDGLLLALSWLVPAEERAEIETARIAFHDLLELRNTPDEGAVNVVAEVTRDYLGRSFAIRKWRE